MRISRRKARTVFPAAVATLLLTLGLAGTAWAHRGAIRAEKVAMIFHASGRYYGGGSVSEPRSTPLRCFLADIATVVKGSQWGAWTFSRYAFSHERRCHTGNGIAIEHKIGKRWYVLWEGSEGYPPTHNKHEGSFTLHGVPRAVVKDLDTGLNPG
jgi:hypothetical protein